MQDYDRSFDLIVREANARRSREIGEAFKLIFVGMFRAVERIAETLMDFLRASSPDEHYLASARSYAELRRRLHEIENRQCQIALEPGR